MDNNLNNIQYSSSTSNIYYTPNTITANKSILYDDSAISSSSVITNLEIEKINDFIFAIEKLILNSDFVIEYLNKLHSKEFESDKFLIYLIKYNFDYLIGIRSKLSNNNLEDYINKFFLEKHLK